jgi:hypothetical protein
VDDDKLTRILEAVTEVLHLLKALDQKFNAILEGRE